MSTDPTAISPPRSNPARRPASTGRLSRIPYTIRYGLPILVVILIGREVWDSWSATRGHMQLVDAAGQPVRAAATAEFFALDTRPFAPSPTPSLGTRELGPSGALTVGVDLIGDGALVRLDVPGHGIAYAVIEPGDEVCDLELGTPSPVRGEVRDADGQPVVGARIQAFGGGPRGVLLGETRTGADGGFVFEGVSDSVRSWSFRVFADDFRLGQLEWLSQPDEVVKITLERSAPAHGRLVPDPSAAHLPVPPLGEFELRIYHLPGVTARTAADGSFTVLHLPPPPMHANVLVPGLPPEWTYRRTALQAGAEREVRLMPSRVLRGRVINGHTGEGVVGAIVHHEHGPDGLVSMTCGSGGAFELGRVPAGTVEVFAHLIVNRLTLPVDVRKEKGRGQSLLIQGTVTVLVRPDVDPDELTITVW